MNNKYFFIIMAIAAIVAVAGVTTMVSASQGRFFGRGFIAEATTTTDPAIKARQDAINDAFKNNDYAKWKETMSNHPMFQYVNETNFARFAEMHNLMQAGKIDEANKIREELKLPQGGRGFGQCSGGAAGGCAMRQASGGCPFHNGGRRGQ